MSKHCRARMIDGTPVTFDWTDRGPIRSPHGDVYRTEIIGHCLHVLSETDRGVSAATRTAVDRAKLERSGIDTKTAVYQGKEDWCWWPLYPADDDRPVIYSKVVHFGADAPYPGDPAVPTPEMIERGARAILCLFKTSQRDAEACAGAVWHMMHSGRPW